MLNIFCLNLISIADLIVPPDWNMNNNSVETRELPSGLGAVAHVTCPEGSRSLNIVVLNPEDVYII